MGFYTVHNDTLVDTTLNYFLLVNDSIAEFYNSPQSARVHFNSTNNHIQSLVIVDTTFAILPDTLNIFYKRNLHYISPNCGYNFFYDIDSIHYTHISIDSAYINNKTVDNDINKEHLKIVF